MVNTAPSKIPTGQPPLPVLESTGRTASVKQYIIPGPFYPLSFQAEGVLSLPASVCLSVCPSVRLKMDVIDLDLQGHFGHFDSEF